MEGEWRKNKIARETVLSAGMGTQTAITFEKGFRTVEVGAKPNRAVATRFWRTVSCIGVTVATPCV